MHAINVVELLVRELETNPVFNSGRGSALSTKGTVEMGALWMVSEMWSSFGPFYY
jgi:isoaspartyl peptidase/L-asparaginase-like protein (Ntn-hydrolase superfamily)